jgi:MFS family permease
MLAVGMIFGSPLQSYLSNKVLNGRAPVIVISSVVVLGLTAALAFRTASIPVFALYLLCLLLGVFGSAVVVIGFTAAKELFPVRMAGTATGLINLFPFAGGAVFQPILGWVLERQGRVGDSFTLAGYQQAMQVLFVCAVIAAASGLFMKETLKK